MTMRCVRVAVVLAVFACGATSRAGAAGAAEPGAGNVAKGKVLYVKHCAGCHGPQGRGDGYKMLGPDPADLTAPATTMQSDASLLRTMHEGKSNMPSWKVRLSDRDSRDVLAYVRTLAKRP